MIFNKAYKSIIILKYTLINIKNLVIKGIMKIVNSRASILNNNKLIKYYFKVFYLSLIKVF